MIFSDAPAEVKENVRRAVGKEQLNITVFPATPEKLLVEIAAKEGDLFIVPEDMFKPFYDPEGLQPLNLCFGRKRAVQRSGQKRGSTAVCGCHRKRRKTFERLYGSVEYRYGAFHTGLCEENP
nr:hypothetical protein [Bacillus licheniformis]